MTQFNFNLIKQNCLRWGLLCFVSSLILISCEKDSGSSTSKTLLTIGSKCTILRSEDGGENWTTTEIEEKAKTAVMYNKSYSVSISDVAFGKDMWVAVGGFASGAVHKATLIISKDDGRSWKNVKVPASSKLNTVVYGNGKFYAGGVNADLISSTDGENWTKIDLSKNYEDNESGVSHLISKIYISGSNIILIGQTKYSGGGFTSYYSDIIESKDFGDTWERVKGIGGEKYSDVLPINNGLMLLGKSYVVKKESDVWTYDNRSGKPQIFSPAISVNNKCYAISNVQASSRIAIYSEGKWNFSESRLSNFGCQSFIYGNGIYLAMGSYMPPAEGMMGTRGEVFVFDNDKFEWKSGRECLGDQYIGSKYSFKGGLFAHNKFMMIAGEYRDPKSAHDILYSTNGYDWKNAVIPSIDNDVILYKIIKAN